ncbi:MAG: PAS domain-containing protein, partial [Burkholderiaceae bacterium]
MHDKTPERRRAARGEPSDRDTAPSGEERSTVDTRSTQGPLHVAVEAVAFRMQDTMPGAAVALLPVTSAARGALPAPVIMSGLPQDVRHALREVDGGALLSCLPRPSSDVPGAPDARASCFPGPHGAAPAALGAAMRRGGYRNACMASVPAADGSIAAVLLALTKTPPPAEVPARLAEGARLCGAALDHDPGADAGALLRPVMDASLDALVLFDPAEGTILLVNCAFTALLGYDLDEAARMPVARLFAPDGNRSPPTPDAAAGDGARTFERRWLRRKDGSLFPADCATTAFAGDGRRLACLALRDVTERFRTERTLSLAARVFDAMGEGVVISGPDNRM